jgi:type VI secretion system protein ImpA
MLSALQPYLPGTATEPAPAPGEEGGSAGGDSTEPGPATGITVSGSIRSRDDVIKALESLCRYYKQVEPGSPVPYLLRRAQKLATMNFVDAMQELNLASVDTLRPSMGSAVDAAAEPPPAT